MRSPPAMSWVCAVTRMSGVRCVREVVVGDWKVVRSLALATKMMALHALPVRLSCSRMMVRRYWIDDLQNAILLC